MISSTTVVLALMLSSIRLTFAITVGIGRRAKGALTKTVRVDGVVMRHFAFSVCIGSDDCSTLGAGGNETRPVVVSIA